jgi:hypothetical protein
MTLGKFFNVVISLGKECDPLSSCPNAPIVLLNSENNRDCFLFPTPKLQTEPFYVRTTVCLAPTDTSTTFKLFFVKKSTNLGVFGTSLVLCPKA